jgi:hypothetical protein
MAIVLGAPDVDGLGEAVLALVRRVVAPHALEDEELARGMVADLTRPERGIIPRGKRFRRGAVRRTARAAARRRPTASRGRRCSATS